MKRRWKIVLAALVLAGLCAVSLLWQGNSVRKAANETCRSLRQNGFQVDLSEFKLSTSPELRARAVVLTAAGQAGRHLLAASPPEIREPLGTNAALVVWKQGRWETVFGKKAWPEVLAELEQSRVVLDEACAAALTGPIYFEPVLSPIGNPLYPHLSDVKTLARILAARAGVELHDNHCANAWTNLQALSRLVTAWNPDPAEISHLVRFACVAIAQDALWEALQAEGWTDEQLARLQREW